MGVIKGWEGCNELKSRPTLERIEGLVAENNRLEKILEEFKALSSFAYQIFSEIANMHGVDRIKSPIELTLMSQEKAECFLSKYDEKMTEIDKLSKSNS